MIKEKRSAVANFGDREGLADVRTLPDKIYNRLWESIIIPQQQKDKLLSQSILNFTLRGKVDSSRLPLHGIILMVGPPGTGKTSLAKGIASRTADSLEKGKEFVFVEVEPHSLASSSLGKSQRAVTKLLNQTISEIASRNPTVVLLDEVETLAARRSRMSLEANPIDVHRATDAVLAQIDMLAQKHTDLLFVATSNFVEAVDEAFISRADLIMKIDKPEKKARELILQSSIEELGKFYPKTLELFKSFKFKKVVDATDGMDGRGLRKMVISACSFDKQTAIDPNKLTIEDLIQAANNEKIKNESL